MKFLPAGALRDIVENEYLTTIAVRALLPDDSTVAATIETVDGVQNRALVVKRFDRLPSGARIHFEEFNQLLGKRSGDDRYEAAYEDMAWFTHRLSHDLARRGVLARGYRRLERRNLLACQRYACFCFANSAAGVTRTPQRARLSPPSAVFASAYASTSPRGVLRAPGFRVLCDWTRCLRPAGRISRPFAV